MSTDSPKLINFQKSQCVPRVRLRMDHKERFPEKLYDVANDGYLVSWNGCGTAVIVNESEFEEKVLSCYPGFVQIPSFLNLRRLFREYGFHWEFADAEESTMEFSHECFKHGHRHLLSEIQTRRKSFNKPAKVMSEFQKRVAELCALDEDSNGESKQYKTRTRTGSVKRLNYMKFEYDTPSPSIDDDCSRSDHSSEFYINDTLSCDGKSETSNKDNDFNLRARDIMNSFIKNEFSFEEFCIWALQNQKSLLMPETTTDFSSFQGNRNDNHYGYVSDTKIPCGNCACCHAFSFQNIQPVYEVKLNPEYDSDLSTSCDNSQKCI